MVGLGVEAQAATGRRSSMEVLKSGWAWEVENDVIFNHHPGAPSAHQPSKAAVVIDQGAGPPTAPK